MLNFAKHIHFVGIGGIGMSGLARIMRGFDVKVSGSDVKDSAVIEGLIDLGVTVHIGHHKKNLAPDVDLLVYSSVIKEENPEFAEAISRGIKIICRAELLGEIMKNRTSIAIAGAHGKTTTTGMMGVSQLAMGENPTIVVGGILPQISSNAVWGSGKYLVAEADESDGSFLMLPAKIAVVNNIENDHLDHYGTMENLIKAFDQFIHQIPDDGFAVLGVDSPIVAQIAESGKGKYITFGMNHDADFMARDIEFNSFGTTSQIYFKGEHLGALTLNVPGIYNISNALAVIATECTLGYEFGAVAESLLGFSGTGRRFELMGSDGEHHISVYDDYAHHPTELKAVISAAKNLDYERVVTVFQPHRYSRTHLLFDEFVECFDETDVLILNEVYAAFEEEIPGVNSVALCEAIKERGAISEVYYAQTEIDVLAALDDVVVDNDIVLIAGAGPIRHAGEVYGGKIKD